MAAHKIPSIYIWLVDGSKSRSYFKIWAALSLSPQALLAEGVALASALPTSCYPYAVTVQYDTICSPPLLVDADSDMSAGATILFTTEDGELQNINLPALLPEYVGELGELVVTGALEELLDMLQAGPWTDSLGRPYGDYMIGGATDEITMAPTLGDV